jgi:hypothetical protein
MGDVLTYNEPTDNIKTKGIPMRNYGYKAMKTNFAPWKKSFGGFLGTNGTDWTSGLKMINNGGTHE